MHRIAKQHESCHKGANAASQHQKQQLPPDAGPAIFCHPSKPGSYPLHALYSLLLFSISKQIYLANILLAFVKFLPLEGGT
jgi:hypothetical protein